MHSPPFMKILYSYYSLFLLAILLFSCRSRQTNFHTISWTESGSNNGISYSINTGNGGKGIPDIQFAGWLIGEKLFLPDSLNEIPPEMDSMFVLPLQNDSNLLKLQKGSIGYIKVDLEKCYLHGLSMINQYTLFYHGSPTANELIKDSVTLTGMGLFEQVDVVTKEEAISSYASVNGSDTAWINLLETNPLPSSIGLRLRKDLFFDKRVDSVKQILQNSFPELELTALSDGKMGLPSFGKKKILIYHFSVL